MSEHLFHPDEVSLPPAEEFKSLYGYTPEEAIENIDSIVSHYLDVAAKLGELREEEVRLRTLRRDEELATLQAEINELSTEKNRRLSPMIVSLKHWIGQTEAYRRYLDA